MKKIFQLATLALIATACGPKANVYTINGVVVDSTLNNKTAYLRDYSAEKVIDSCVVTDLKFTFTGNPDSLNVLRIDLGRNYANLLAENGVINVTMDRPSVVSGTPLNDLMAAYTKESSDFNKLISEEYKALKDAGATEATIDSLFEVSNNTLKQITDKYFEGNKANKLGVYLIWSKIMGNMSVAQIDSLTALNGTVAQNFGPIQRIRKATVNKEETSAGRMFVDFPGTSADGTAAKLSDYVGKGNYVLADFWASWCGPCKAEVPVIKEVYKNFKDKGLVVLGVNVWDKKDGFDKAVVDLEMPWAQLCVFDGNIATDTYGINGIPHLILFAPDGTIVERDLRGDALKAAVANAYKK